MSDQPDRPHFGVFDPNRFAEIKGRNLPHWFQAGAAVFVTFRTADSLPKPVVLRMQQEFRDWIIAKQWPLVLADGFFRLKTTEFNQAFEALSDKERASFVKQSGRLMYHELDCCHGDCPFRRPDLAALLAEQLLHFDGRKYDLDCFVIMPNHVHAIVQFRRGYDMKVVSQSWLRYSAREINKVLGRTGEFWQREPFDHLIRSVRQFEYLRGYIVANPRIANLRDGEYRLYLR